MLRRPMLAVLFTAAVAVPASAQVTPPPTSGAPLVQAGPFGISPSLLLREFGVDENVFNERDNPRDDFTFTIVPRAEILFKPHVLRLTYVTALEYVYYQTYESERSTNLSSSVRADFELGRFQPYALATGTNTRQRLNAEVDTRAPHQQRVYEGGLGVRVGTRLTLGAAGRTTRLRFEEGEFRGEDLATSFDSDIDMIEGSAAMQLTPFTRFSMVVSQEKERFRLAPERDSESLRITPTFAFSPEAVLNGSIAIGYRKFTPESAALPAYSGLVATATIGTTLWNRNRVEIVFARDVRYSYERTTPYYLATGGNAVVTTQLAGPFEVRFTGAHQVLAYRGLSLTGTERPGDDTVSSAGGGIGYRIRELLRLGVNIEWSGRESQMSDDREYRNRRIFASVTWGKQI